MVIFNGQVFLGLRYMVCYIVLNHRQK